MPRTVVISDLQAYKKLSRGMTKLADESELFESKTIFGLLRGAPDLLPNVKHIEEMFKPINGEGVCGSSSFRVLDANHRVDFVSK
jgi:hypothetical protein